MYHFILRMGNLSKLLCYAVFQNSASLVTRKGFNKDLEIPETCNSSTQIVLRTTSLNPNVIFSLNYYKSIRFTKFIAFINIIFRNFIVLQPLKACSTTNLVKFVNRMRDVYSITTMNIITSRIIIRNNKKLKKTNHGFNHVKPSY
jgi:hypothetical protein